jgi:hypothetical protein
MHSKDRSSYRAFGGDEFRQCFLFKFVSRKVPQELEEGTARDGSDIHCSSQERAKSGR